MAGRACGGIVESSLEVGPGVKAMVKGRQGEF